MNQPINAQPSFFTLLLLISFASVNAVLFTPALPNIAHFFQISGNSAQLTIIWFLVGYTLGQLLYGPVANRFGRKPALYTGISVQIISSFLCVLSGFMHAYWLLVLARFTLALGSGVGLKMTFTLVNECYEPQVASQKTSYLILAFAITPGLGVALGGILNQWYGWTSCFYAGAIYGAIMLLLVTRLPETLKIQDLDAFHIKHLLECYKVQFYNKKLFAEGLLMGAATSFVYLFSAVAPFLAINVHGMSSANYGLANLLPPIGLVTGSLVGAELSKKIPLQKLMQIGITIACLGVALMLCAMLLHLPIIFSLFASMIIIYFGLCFVMANAPIIALSDVTDKAHGSAVMSFTNMGFATIAVLGLGMFSLHTLLLPEIYIVLCLFMAYMAKR